MELFVSTILKALILVPMTLLPIINPLGAAPVFVATVGNDRDRVKRLARQIAINSWFVLVASMLIGTYVLALFGISLPVVRVGGGLLLATAGWRMLHTTEDNDVQAAAAEEASTLSNTQLMQHSFFPMTFPLTTGPGAISASIALGTQISTANPVIVRRRRDRRRSRIAAGVDRAVLRLPQFHPAARLARRNRHAGDDAVDGIHPVVYRHSDHVDRLGRTERNDALTFVYESSGPRT